jgi:hypothetical protein
MLYFILGAIIREPLGPSTWKFAWRWSINSLTHTYVDTCICVYIHRIHTTMFLCKKHLHSYLRLLEKLTGSQLDGKFSAFYRTRRFIAAFTIARHVSLNWARSIQSIPPSHFLNIHFNIIPQSMPGSSKWSLSLRFPYQNPVYTSTHPHTRHMPRPSHSSWFDHPVRNTDH